MEHETTSHIRPELMFRREQLLQQLGFASLRLTHAHEAHLSILNDLLELHQLIRNEEQS